MPESVPPASSIAEQGVARAVVRISLAVEQTAELLEDAKRLHGKLVDLHAALTEPLVDLERLLTDIGGGPSE